MLPAVLTVWATPQANGMATNVHARTIFQIGAFLSLFISPPLGRMPLFSDREDQSDEALPVGQGSSAFHFGEG